MTTGPYGLSAQDYTQVDVRSMCSRAAAKETEAPTEAYTRDAANCQSLGLGNRA